MSLHVSDFKKELRVKGFVVVSKSSSEMFGYDSLNYEAAKIFGLKMPRNEIWVDKNLVGLDKWRSVYHEFVELIKIRFGTSYWDGHKFASFSEKDLVW